MAIQKNAKRTHFQNGKKHLNFFKPKDDRRWTGAAQNKPNQSQLQQHEKPAEQNLHNKSLSTIRENPRNPRLLFLTNKANLKKDENASTPFKIKTKDYRLKTEAVKNKPNQSQFF